MPSIDAQEGAILAQLGQLQVVLQCRSFHNERDALSLSVKLIKEGLIPETVWIVLKEVASKLAIEDADCSIVCPYCTALKGDCHHGDYIAEPMYHSN